MVLEKLNSKIQRIPPAKETPPKHSRDDSSPARLVTVLWEEIVEWPHEQEFQDPGVQTKDGHNGESNVVDFNYVMHVFVVGEEAEGTAKCQLANAVQGEEL